MKLSNLILLLLTINIVIFFTKAGDYIEVKLWYSLVLFGAWSLFKIIELKRENNKRRRLVREIRTGVY